MKQTKTKTLRKNIILAYILSFLYGSWFSMGIWALYNLRFTSKTGLGVLETITSLTLIGAKIPSGALSDLLGRRLSLFIAFSLGGLGYFLRGSALNFGNLAVAAIILSLGDVLYSTTMPAFVYDTLKQLRLSREYTQILSKQESIFLSANAIAGLVGGWVYQNINERLPFYLNALFYLTALILVIFINEPDYKRKRFSWTNYRKQFKEGLNNLWSNRTLKDFLGLFIPITTTIVFMYELFDDLILIEYKLSAFELGLTSAFILAASAIIVNRLGWLDMKNLRLFLILSSIYIMSLLLTPWVGVLVGISLILIRSVVAVFLDIAIGYQINRSVASGERATTMATFSMLSEIPYAIGIIGLSAMADYVGGRWVVFGLGMIMAIVLLGWGLEVMKKEGRGKDREN